MIRPWIMWPINKRKKNTKHLKFFESNDEINIYKRCLKVNPKQPHLLLMMKTIMRCEEHGRQGLSCLSLDYRENGKGETKREKLGREIIDNKMGDA